MLITFTRLAPAGTGNFCSCGCPASERHAILGSAPTASRATRREHERETPSQNPLGFIGAAPFSAAKSQLLKDGHRSPLTFIRWACAGDMPLNGHNTRRRADFNALAVPKI
jgi:hypothetical protein